MKSYGGEFAEPFGEMVNDITPDVFTVRKCTQILGTKRFLSSLWHA